MYKNLKAFRQSLDMSQKEFAASLGIGYTTYNGYETGAREPKSDFWIAIAKKYGVTIDYLMGYSNSPHKTAGKWPAPLSSGALQLAQDYDKLDRWGQRAVRGLTDFELTRYTEQARSDVPPELDKVVYITSYYPHPASAGTGQPAGDDGPEELLLKKRPPRGTSYVAPISGRSMEPTYHDGDKLFVCATADIMPGQVGVFYMDGQQWIKELGDGVLLSHNPAYPPRPMTDDIQCQGLVLGVCDDSYF